MIKNFLSQWSFSYPRKLVYMLQATEYDIRDYLAWLRRTENFSAVEKRKKFVATPKAVLLLAIAWAIVLLVFAIAAYYLSAGAYVLGILIFLAAPYILAYSITIPLIAVKVIVQLPAEFFITRTAGKLLASHKGVKIAVAGSFGKTTMREILKTVLSEGGKTAAPPHSYNTLLGISKFAKTLDGDEKFLVFELGEYYPGDVRKLCGIVRPDIGVVTGINEAHLQKFKKIERTAGTIFELADYLGGRPLYVNGENGLAFSGAPRGSIIYSRDGVDGWEIKDKKTGLDGTSFTMEKNGVKLALKSKLLGLHQIGPLAAAAALASNLGLPKEKIEQGISKTKPFDHRLEPKTDSSGVTTLDDSYNGNPDGVKAVIEFLESLEGRRRFYVTPGLVEMGPKTEEIHRKIGKWLSEAGIEKVVLVKNSATPFIEKGLAENGYKGEIIKFDDAQAAFAALPHMTVSGDVVLLQNDWPDQYQ